MNAGVYALQIKKAGVVALSFLLAIHSAVSAVALFAKADLIVLQQAVKLLVYGWTHEFASHINWLLTWIFPGIWLQQNTIDLLSIIAFVAGRAMIPYLRSSGFYLRSVRDAGRTFGAPGVLFLLFYGALFSSQALLWPALLFYEITQIERGATNWRVLGFYVACSAGVYVTISRYFTVRPFLAMTFFVAAGLLFHVISLLAGR